MNLFDAIRFATTKHVERLAEQAVADHIASDAFAERIREILRENPRFVFIKQMQARYQRRCPNLPDRRAFEIARDTLNSFLADDKIEFGDPRYDWSRSGADTLADEDLTYWEAA